MGIASDQALTLISEHMRKQWNENQLAFNSRNHLELDFDVAIPFVVLRGSVASPSVVVLAGIHGDEYEGVAALQRLAVEIDPSELTGTVILVPVANPQAFAAGLRRHPLDSGDLNRSFPGSPDGSVSSRLAALVLSEFIEGNDAMLSLHGWSKEALVLPYVEYPIDDSELGRKSKECALRLGFDYVHPYIWPSGVLGNSALEMGVAAVETEIGGQGTITVEGQRLSRQIIFRFLDFWGVLPRREDASTREPVEVDHVDMFAEYAGLFESTLQVGEDVEPGAELAVIRELSGKVVQELRSPVSGKVAILRTFASVQPGDRLVQIFVPRTGV